MFTILNTTEVSQSKADENTYTVIPSYRMKFGDWSRDDILWFIFCDYRSGRLVLRFDPFDLLDFTEDDLKKLFLIIPSTNDYAYDSGILWDEAECTINYPLLASLSKSSFYYLCSKLGITL